MNIRGLHMQEPNNLDDSFGQEETSKRGSKRGRRKQPGEKRRQAKRSPGRAHGTRIVPV
jgi:hypothetical protein